MQMKFHKFALVTAAIFPPTTAESQDSIRIRGSELPSIDFVRQEFSGALPSGENVIIKINRVGNSSKLCISALISKSNVGNTIIDVSLLPNFDLYSMSPSYYSNSLIVEFKYGSYKKCIINDDGRDRLYLKFRDNTVTYQRVPVRC